MNKITFTSVLALSVLIQGVTAQEAKKNAAPPAAAVSPQETQTQETQTRETQTRETQTRETLTKAIQKMTQLNGVSFQTIETQNSAMSRNIARQVGRAMGGPAEVESRGSWGHGILNARLNDDADQVVSYNGRMIAKNDDVEWKLRRNRLVTGGAMPFVIDPGQFFEALQSLPKGALSIKETSKRQYKGKEVTVIGLTLQGSDAQDFALSGALPPISSGMGGGMMVMRAFGGGGGAAAALPDLTVDLAFYVDPTTGYIYKVKSRSYQESQGGGNFQIQVQGGGGGGFGGGGLGDGDEEEETNERDEKGKRIYKAGLPVRKLGDNLSRMDYDVVFTNHDLPIDHKLDSRARKLLRMSQK